MTTSGTTTFNLDLNEAVEEAKRRRDMEAAYERSRGAKKFAKGGVTRADGCVRKGHTKGTMR